MTSSRRAFLRNAAALALWPADLFGAARGNGGAMPASHAALWENPDGTATDSVMVRRLYLDLAGRIPSADEARAYVLSDSPEKRMELVGKLLASREFADCWTMRFCDILRVKSEFPVNLWPNAVYVYHARIRAFVESGETWEHFGRALLTAQGSNFRDAEVNFFRATDRRDPEGWADAVAQTFYGIPPGDPDGGRREFAASCLANVRIKKTREWKEEIVYVEGEDRRNELCDMIFVRDRQAVADAFATRLRRWIYGPWALLQLPSGGESCVLKDAIREIVLSPEYARGSVTGGFPARRLDAEVLDDAFCALGDSKRSYLSPAPEPFSFLPPERPTVCIEDGSVSSGFLSLFGRPARDTGLMDERGSDVTAKQRLYLFNSGDIHRKLGRVAYASPASERLERIYWSILSRPPSAYELRVVGALWKRRRGGAGKVKSNYGELLRDVAWCLINTKEFLYRI